MGANLNPMSRFYGVELGLKSTFVIITLFILIIKYSGIIKNIGIITFFGPTFRINFQFTRVIFKKVCNVVPFVKFLLTTLSSDDVAYTLSIIINNIIIINIIYYFFNILYYKYYTKI